MPLWNLWFLAIVCFSLAWLKVMLYFWVVMDTPSILPIKAAPVLVQGLIFYAIYSFGNYWFHRWKHASGILWRCLHRFHHAPTHMESRVAFYRHPLEILANTLYLFLLGKFLVGVPAEGVAIALAIEASLEIFHHSNIRIPPKYRQNMPCGFPITFPPSLPNLTPLYTPPQGVQYLFTPTGPMGQYISNRLTPVAFYCYHQFKAA